MTFNIGNQYAGVANNVAGDQRIGGGQHGTLIATEAALHTIDDLRTAVTQARLTAHTRAAAQAHIAEIEAELHQQPEPDRAHVAGTLERLAHLLTAAGALTNAGSMLVGPLRALAGWLGNLGAPILALLPS